MAPYLITPPASAPVALADLKAHLRVAHSDDDADILAKLDGAVASLDAWGGVLGRCIMPQVWAIDVTGPGPHLLPFPDATSVIATSGGDAVDVVVTRHGAGLVVRAESASADQALTIQATYGLPATRLPSAQTIIKLMVQREFDVMAGSDYDAITRSIDWHIGALRWVPV
jgi:uncharacterized phiE125 gp8 family phage protein